MRAFPSVNILQDKTLQRKYNGFYRVRRNTDWQNAYYGIMERGKQTAPDFESVMKELYDKTGRVEASFASKLIHTLNNDMPIWDQFVLLNPGLKMPLCKREVKIQKSICIYREIIQRYQAARLSREMNQKILEFDEAFPEYQRFSKTKKRIFHCGKSEIDTAR